MVNNRIPKVINYCWFGENSKNKLIKKCIKSWKKYCPDYEIIEWNEKNFDINMNKYVKEAYNMKKWAFVSDYARLYIIYNNGGIYLDTDVELIKSLDGLLKYSAFISSEDNKCLNTGLGFGAEKENIIIKKMLDSYKNLTFIKENGELDLLPCTIRNTETLKEIYSAFSDKNKVNVKDNIAFLPKEFFCPYNSSTGKMNKTNNTIGIHWFNASWRPTIIQFKRFMLRPLKRIIGMDNFNKIKSKIKK